MLLKKSTPIRFSILYFLFFLMIGTYGPFWPVWLSSIDVSPKNIGIALASATILKVILGPIFARLNDNNNNDNSIILYISLLSTLTFFSIVLINHYYDSARILIIILGCLAWGFFSSSIPLLEAKTILLTSKQSLDYGKIRLWGSISFIVAAVGVGILIEHTNKNIVIRLILLFSFLASCAIYFTPKNNIKNKRRITRTFYHLINLPGFFLFLLCCGCIQASHSFYYAFSSITWLKNGLSSSFIGCAWALGVLAEITLFALFANKLKNFSPKILIKFAAIITIIRWIILSLTSNPVLILIAQTGHAASYGITHLAAMYYISTKVSSEIQGSAQSIYASISMGILPAIIIPFSGIIYTVGGGSLGFISMATLALIGLCLSQVLKH